MKIDYNNYWNPEYYIENAEINKKNVLAAKAVSFTVSGVQVANSPYTIRISGLVTNSSPAQTLAGDVELIAEA